MSDELVKVLWVPAGAWDAVTSTLERAYPKMQIVQYPENLWQEGAEDYMFTIKGE